MNNHVRHLPNGDFTIDPVLAKSRAEAIESQSNRVHFPMLKGKKDEANR